MDKDGNLIGFVVADGVEDEAEEGGVILVDVSVGESSRGDQARKRKAGQLGEEKDAGTEKPKHRGRSGGRGRGARRARGPGQIGARGQGRGRGRGRPAAAMVAAEEEED